MREQLIQLRQKMKEYGIDAYLVPTTDFHGSEYVNDYFKCRTHLSGLPVRQGTLAVTMDDARLCTDGRYFLQAAIQLEGSDGIRLMKMDQPGVPTIAEYLEGVLSEGSRVGFDGRVVDFTFGHELEEKYNLCFDVDLAGEIWDDRPKLLPTEIYSLPLSVCGETCESKLARIRKEMKKVGADYHLITKLEEIAWIYNLRGRDVEFTPVFYGFALIEQDKARLYTLGNPGEVEASTTVLPYFQIFEDIKALEPGKILLNEKLVSYAMVRSLPEKVEIIDLPDPAELMKAIKNQAEIESTLNAHVKDGIAMVNFLFWLKKNIGKIPMSEISAADYLADCRKQGAYDFSFETISGYEGNGAIVHYAATEKTNKTLRPEGLLLVDSGGQYPDGTTDITRTIALGPLTEEMKRDYTAVLKAHIRLARANFIPVPPEPSWTPLPESLFANWVWTITMEPGMEWDICSAFMKVPNTISPKGIKAPILPGMITSDEPGVYLEGKFGIRLENEVLCVEEKPEVYRFRPITFCPFDREAISVEMLESWEIEFLNSYHKTVCDTLSPHLDAEVRSWLEVQTGEI